MCPVRQPGLAGIPIRRSLFATRTTRFESTQDEIKPCANTQATANILTLLIELENTARSEYTIKNVNKFLSLLSEKTDLANPDSVFAHIAARNVTSNTKAALCYAYKTYCKRFQIDAKIPFYKAAAKAVKIPTKEKLEMFIANASKTLATQLTISMETGLRPIELCNLRVKDVDLEQRTLYPATAKHGSARTLKISQSLAAMIQTQASRTT